MSIEGVVANTNTRSSPALAKYYEYWEKKMYNAITKMIITSLNNLQVLLNFPLDGFNTQAALAHHERKKWKRFPVCKIMATMNAYVSFFYVLKRSRTNEKAFAREEECVERDVAKGERKEGKKGMEE